MSKLMSEIPTENENFLRFVLFFIEVGTETVLKVFYHYKRLRPTIVTFPIGENYDLRQALPYAWYRYVIEERSPDSLDISILIKLLQTLFSEVLPTPKYGWGGNVSGDLTVSADLNRLRRIRNDIVAHANRASLASGYFANLWNKVEQILIRLVKVVDPKNQTKLEETFKEYRQKTIGAPYAKKCRDYLTKQIDEMNQMFKDFSLLWKDKQYTPFLRYIKLLVDGGRLIFTAYLNKLIKDSNSLLRNTLLEKQVKVLEELGGHQAMIVQVYPKNEKVDTNTTNWDISVIAKVIVSVCTSYVDVDDIDAIKTVREAREKYAYTALYAITSDKRFHDECEDLLLNLSHLARSIGGNAKQEFIQVKAVYRFPSKMASEEVGEYLNQLKRPGFDIKEIKDIHKECVSKLRTELSTNRNIDFNVNENFELELMIQIACQDKEKQNEAESILYNVIKDIIADPQGKREESPVLPEVRQTLDTIRGIPTVRLTCVKKSCLLITVESNSSEDLMTLVDYVDSSNFQNQLNGISTELDDMFDDVFILKGHFTLESIQQTLVHIEVKVDPLTDTPWRAIGTWNKEIAESLLSDIKDFKTGQKIKNVRLLLIGPIHAGKSSFINSVASIDAGCISAPVDAGVEKHSVTKKLAVYRPDTRLQGFRLIDTMGVEDKMGQGLHVEDVANIINGHLKHDYRFDSDSAADKSSPEFITDPKNKDKAHCVLYVMDAREIYFDNISDSTKAKITALQDHIKHIGVKQILIITHTDCLCPEVKKKLRNTFRSKRVQEAVRKGSRLFGLPEMNIFPVENYHNDVKLDSYKDILLLYALRQAMIFSKHYLKMEAQKERCYESSDED